MNIISTTDVSREGNDCYIHQTETLVEFCGMYAVIECVKITGWWEEKDVRVMHTTDDYNEAVNFYKNLCGGILEDWKED